MLMIERYCPPHRSIKIADRDGLPPKWMRIIKCMKDITGPCPYLEGKESRLEIREGSLNQEDYEALLEDGWRRSGELCYRNACPGCAQCIPLRRTAELSISRRERRLGRANSDLKIELRDACLDEEHFLLYMRYLDARHGYGEDCAESYLALTAVPFSKFVDYRLGSGRLVAFGFVDIATRSLSSAYFAFDPDASWRSLGSFSVFAESRLAMAMGKSRYYLGYWVPGSPKMRYKADFPPFEILMPETGIPSGCGCGQPSGSRGRWTAFDSRAEAEEALRKRG